MREKKVNPEIRDIILNTLFEIEYTHTYAIGFVENKIIKAAIIENADSILPLITYAEKQAESHGAVWGVRIWARKQTTEILKTYAREVIDICTVDYMEREYAINGNRGNNNRGHIFERLCAEVMDGEQVKNKCAKCIDSGDIIVNDEHIQCKYCNATVTTEVTMRNLYKEYQKRVA
jgi:hypothetical protein